MSSDGRKCTAKRFQFLSRMLKNRRKSVEYWSFLKLQSITNEHTPPLLNTVNSKNNTRVSHDTRVLTILVQYAPRIPIITVISVSFRQDSLRVQHKIRIIYEQVKINMRYTTLKLCPFVLAQAVLGQEIQLYCPVENDLNIDYGDQVTIDSVREIELFFNFTYHAA